MFAGGASTILGVPTLLERAWTSLKRSWFVIALFVALGAVGQVEIDNARKNTTQNTQLKHSQCVGDRAAVEEFNRRGVAINGLRDAVKIFAAETRRARANPQGTSYSPGFVFVIDHQITPRLNSIDAAPLAVPRC